MKQRLGVKEDTAVPASGWKRAGRGVQAILQGKSPAKRFPTIRWSNSGGAIGAVFGSWMAEKGRHLPPRRKKSTGLLGTAVNVVQMVFGNTGDKLRHGRLASQRDPSSGEKIFYGDYLTKRHRVKTLWAGIRTPVRLAELQKDYAEGLRAT